MINYSSGADRITVRPATVGERLTRTTFSRLSGTVAGYPFLKLVVDRADGVLHFLDHARHALHVQYMAERVLGVPLDELMRDIDSFNHEVYYRPDRRYYLGSLALHHGDEEFLTLETVEADTMSAELLVDFFTIVRRHLDPALDLLLKPANHAQEQAVADIPATELPRILGHELFSTARYVPLNTGVAHGRLRAFRSEADYLASTEPLARHDIVVMPKVPDDIPRLAGMINAEHTTPLSHTNVLATGWGIPNAIRIGVLDDIDQAGLDGRWVTYRVEPGSADLVLAPAEQNTEVNSTPAEGVRLPGPDLGPTSITPLSLLRAEQNHRFGTKAANLGELCDVLQHGSARWLDYYRVPRGPRRNLLGYLAQRLDVTDPTDELALHSAATMLVKQRIRVPRGVALPFGLYQRFLASAPDIRQHTAGLRTAVRNDTGLDEPCRRLQESIRRTVPPADLRADVEDALDKHLFGVDRFVVRSSSNAEDLAGFSAAGIYESVPNTTPHTVFDSIREVWASLMSPRAVLLREQAGLPFDDCHMGVIVQEQVAATLGGVLVSCNPLHGQDFRNVYLNISPHSVTDVVTGTGAPMQQLYNTVEGGGRTLSLGDHGRELDPDTRRTLADLALVSRLLQAHFAPPEDVDVPVDIEWAVEGSAVHLLQLRPYRS